MKSLGPSTCICSKLSHWKHCYKSNMETHKWYGRYGFGRSTFQEPKLSGGEALVGVTRTRGNNYILDMASCSHVITANVPDLPSSPHYFSETFSFPKRNYKGCLVFISTLRQWPFLHYDESNDLAYWHTCAMAFKQKRMRTCGCSFTVRSRR